MPKLVLGEVLAGVRKKVMSTTRFYTNEQITKLDCDAHVFLEVARLAANHRDKKRAVPGSTAYTSITTAMMTNLGLALELRLKVLHARVKSPIPYTHELVQLYDKLGESVRSKLTGIYEQFLKDWESEEDETDIFRAYVTAKETEEEPSQQPQLSSIETLRGLLSYLDDIGLYSRRYSFENYSSHEWWLTAELEFFSLLLSRLTEYTNELAESNALELIHDHHHRN